MNGRGDQHGPARAEATLALLWERIRRRGDMPGFTRAIHAVLAAMRGEDERDFSMARTVLSDPVLTQKVLRLANSGMYAAFGQRIDTVSKAVLVLGTEAIGHLALGLKLVEELGRTAPDTLQAQVQMEKAVLAAKVAQQVAARAALRDPEEAVVCAILHSLGRMMVVFYLPERWALLQRAQAAAGGDAGALDAAALDQLGLGLEQVGRATAERWGLPRKLVAGMRRIDPGARPAGFGHEDWLAALGTLSSACAESLWDADPRGAARVAQLACAFAAMLAIPAEQLQVAIEQARQEAAAELALAPLARPPGQPGPPRPHPRPAPACRMREPGNQALAAGLAALRDAASASASQLMSMALETICRGLSCTRAFGFLRSRREGRYAARIAHGDGAQALRSRLLFEDAREPNVLFTALGTDRVVYVENARDPKFAGRLPAWWKENLASARCFVLIPLCAHGEPVGFLYADWDERCPAVYLDRAGFALLDQLRAPVLDALAPSALRPPLEALPARA